MGPKLTTFRIGALVFALFLLNGVLLATYHHLKARLYNTEVPVGATLINELGGAVAGACLFGLLLYSFWKLPSRPSTWRGWLLIHSTAVLLYSFFHTTAHLGIRSVFYPWFGYGQFHPGDIRLRYAMELPNDVLTYSKWLLLFLVFEYYRRLRDREMAASELVHNLTEARLQNLQAQMQPHFLMNSLNAISSLIYTNPRAADEMIARLGSFLRRLLSVEQDQQVSLEHEIDSVRTYIDIMQMRYEDRLKYRCEIDPEVSAARVPPLSLQPLVENSILHGANPKDFTVEIDVTARRRGDRLELAVRDHGAGVPPDARYGVGLRNLKSRMANLYGDRQTVSIETAEGGGTVVRLLIPQNG